MWLLTAIVILLLAVVAIAFLIYSLYLRSKNQRILKELEQTRTNFFTNITHEFRTPLTVIQSAAQDIHSKNKADKVLQRDSADILRHSNALLDLVNQVLEIAKMTSGVAAAPKWKRGDIVGFISMICERYVRYAQERNIDIQYAFDRDSLEMEFIPDYMMRIVQNLVTNAIKFSKDDSQILVSTKVVAQNGKNCVQLYVCDFGVGMNAQQKQNIFKPFYQASTDSRNIGSGIGLSLVKLAVEAMDGTVEVHSYPSEGSVFIVTLPVRSGDESLDPIDVKEYESLPVQTQVSVELPEDETSNATDAPRILIVEDTPEVARWQMRQLNPEYNFYFAADGEEGLSKAEDIVPDLIITDIMMPKMDGIQMCRKIRESELLCHIPVIMVTAKVTPEDKVRGLEAGADAYLEKPFNPEELAVRVEKLLQQREMLKKKFTDLQDAEGVTASEISISDRAFIDKLSSVIHEHISRGKLDYDELASSFFVGKTQLNRKIKAVTGYTTTEYILQIRISMAKQLLVKTDMSIGEIASRVGVDDVAYFSSIFRKATGKTPTAYRNR
jgi:DNA-binding response OmpR family regulator/nitrogen-specific signal transduction histidine kinase